MTETSSEPEYWTETESQHLALLGQVAGPTEVISRTCLAWLRLGRYPKTRFLAFPTPPHLTPSCEGAQLPVGQGPSGTRQDMSVDPEIPLTSVTNDSAIVLDPRWHHVPRATDEHLDSVSTRSGRLNPALSSGATD